MRNPCILLMLLLLSVGCKFFKGDSNTNTTISGKISIAVDETVTPVVEAEVELFCGIYQNASITAKYLPEHEIFEKLLKDSVQLIFASRQLREDETLIINQKKLFPKQIKIATDAIALIVHPSFKSTVISMRQIRSILKGEISTWKQLDPSLQDSAIKVVFDHSKSGIVNFLADSICHGGFKPLDASAVLNNRQVIDYTATHPGTLGFIGGSWISNKSDSLHLSFHKRIKVLSVSESDSPTAENSFKPYQAYLLDQLYPLTRSIYMINTEPRNGLCTGFSSFVASDKGQRIILKSGIIPAIAPTRVVNVRPNL